MEYYYVEILTLLYNLETLIVNTNNRDQISPKVSNICLKDSFCFKNKDVITYSYPNSQTNALSKIVYNSLILTMQLKIVP